MFHKLQVPSINFVMVYNFCIFSACKAPPQVVKKIRGKKKTVVNTVYVKLHYTKFIAKFIEEPLDIQYFWLCTGH